jgi:integrase
MSLVPRPSSPESRPTLRLFAEEGPDLPGSPGDLSAGMRLSAFYRNWFRPVVLVEASAGTLAVYDDAINYWVQLSGDPPIDRIDELAIANFRRLLKAARWRRSPIGREYPLAPATQAKHLGNLRAVLLRTGPTLHPARPSAELVARAAWVPVSKPKHTPKRCFELDTARRLWRTCGAMTWGERLKQLWPSVAAATWWRGFLAIAFYTGLRESTILALNWGMVARRSDGVWLEIPPSAVAKTHKGLIRYLHPHAAEATAALGLGVGPEDLILPYRQSASHFDDEHRRLQCLAGIPAEAWLSPQAWRRTYTRQMGLVGLGRAMGLAQWSADHADAKTTREHYADLEPEVIRRLPRLDG